MGLFNSSYEKIGLLHDSKELFAQHFNFLIDIKKALNQ